LRAGRLFCWGEDEWGELIGSGAKRLRISSPTQVESDSDWQSVTLGYEHVCGVRAGRLYCWGANDFGALGTGKEHDEFGPAQIGEAADWESVSAGGSNTCAIGSGVLYCWGDDYHGQVPGAVVDPAMPHVRSPLRIGSESDWQSIAVGGEFSCGTRAGRLNCWGLGLDGQLGLGGDRFVAAPVPVGEATDWHGVSAGGSRACALRADRVYCWGSKETGTPGSQSPASASSPQRIGKAAEWQSVSAGNDYACGVRAGALYCWGKFPGRDTPALEPTPIVLE
jgi:alpha-tubulin suppressor-like RCC1 family protein